MGKGLLLSVFRMLSESGRINPNLVGLQGVCGTAAEKACTQVVIQLQVMQLERIIILASEVGYALHP